MQNTFSTYTKEPSLLYGMCCRHKIEGDRNAAVKALLSRRLCFQCLSGSRVTLLITMKMLLVINTTCQSLEWLWITGWIHIFSCTLANVVWYGIWQRSALIPRMKMLLLINKISNMHGLCKNKTHKYSKTGTKWNNTGRYGDGDSPVHHNCKHTTHDTVLYHMCVKSVFSNQLLNRIGDLQ